MGLLALVLCFSLPSCSDDDDENKQTEQEAQRGMLELLNLKMNLCLVNLKGEPTEATFGIAMSETKKDKRIYYTKDLQSAKKRYQSLFHSDTRCSEDGCTYTLANKQGTATFTEVDGNKGELAIATFDVPGLKGLVKTVHFIDYTQRGENSYDDSFDDLYPGCFVRVSANDTKWNGIALGPLKGSEDIWVLFTPSIQKDLKNYRATGFIDQSMLPEGSEKTNIMDYTSATGWEDDVYDLIRLNTWDFLFNKRSMYSDAEENWNFVVANYRDYMKQIVETAKAQGYVSTVYGRRRYLPELKSANFNMRSFGERLALNMPVQGTAADIIKLAMVNVHRRLKAEGLKARLILQVHDELIVECPGEEAEQVRQILTEEMENAARLSVPLLAEAHIGHSWAEAH